MYRFTLVVERAAAIDSAASFRENVDNTDRPKPASNHPNPKVLEAINKFSQKYPVGDYQISVQSNVKGKSGQVTSAFYMRTYNYDAFEELLEYTDGDASKSVTLVLYGFYKRRPRTQRLVLDLDTGGTDRKWFQRSATSPDISLPGGSGRWRWRSNRRDVLTKSGSVSDAEYAGVRIEFLNSSRRLVFGVGPDLPVLQSGMPVKAVLLTPKTSDLPGGSLYLPVTAKPQGFPRSRRGFQIRVGPGVSFAIRVRGVVTAAADIGVAIQIYDEANDLYATFRYTGAGVGLAPKVPDVGKLRGPGPPPTAVRTVPPAGPTPTVFKPPAMTPAGPKPPVPTPTKPPAATLPQGSQGLNVAYGDWMKFDAPAWAMLIDFVGADAILGALTAFQQLPVPGFPGAYLGFAVPSLTVLTPVPSPPSLATPSASVTVAPVGLGVDPDFQEIDPLFGTPSVRPRKGKPA